MLTPEALKIRRESKVLASCPISQLTPHPIPARTPEEYAKLMAEDAKAYEGMPQIAKDVLREEGNAGRQLDPEFHVWVGPRIVINADLGSRSNEREAHVEVIIQEAIVRFRDLHPTQVRFTHPEPAMKYIGSLRRLISRKTNALVTRIRTARGLVAGSTQVSNKSVESSMNRIFGKRGYVRAHDLWANDDSVREKLHLNFVKWLEGKAEEMGREEAFKKRVSLLEEFRRRQFAKEHGDVQKKWIDEVKNPTQPQRIDQASFVVQWLPVLHLVCKWFSEESGAPVLLATGAKSLSSPGFADIYM